MKARALIAAWVIVLGAAHGDEVALPKLTLPKVDVAYFYRKDVFRLRMHEAVVDGELIEKIIVLRSRVSALSPMGVMIWLKNKKSEPVHPSFTLRLFNDYGMELGVVSVLWKDKVLKPGERYPLEFLPLESLELQSTFRMSGLQLPEDWAVITTAVLLP